MGVGSILVGGALVLLVGAYLVRPFRKVAVESAPDWVIEAWVAQVRERDKYADTELYAGGVRGELEYCTKCGRRAEPDDYFCAQCGAQLQEVGNEVV